MSVLRQFTEHDFCTTYTDDAEMETVSKKIYEPVNSKHEFIAIRKDYLLAIDQEFDKILADLDKTIASLEEKQQKIHILNECCMNLENELGKMAELLKPKNETRN